MRLIWIAAGMLAAGAFAAPAQAQSANCVDFTVAGTAGKVCNDGKKLTIEANGQKIAAGDWEMVPESRGYWQVEGKLPGVPKLAFQVGSMGEFENKLAVMACVADATTLSAGKTKIDYAKGACDKDWRPLADFAFKDPS